MADEQTLTPEAQAQAALDARAGQSVPPVPISAPVVGSNPTGQTLGSAALASAPALSILGTPIQPGPVPGAMLASALGAKPAAPTLATTPTIVPATTPIGPPTPSAEVLAQSPENKPAVPAATSTPANTLHTLNQQYLAEKQGADQTTLAGLDRTQLGIDHATKVANAMSSGTTIAQQQNAEYQAANLEAEQKARAMVENNMAARDADIKAKMAQVKEVDPDRRSIPMKILGAIGMAGGAYGAGITHSHNFAMEIINNQISNDVEAQKSNIEKQWKQIAGQNELYKNANIRDQWQLEQYSKYREFMYRQTADAVATMAAQSGNAQTTAKLGMLGQELNNEADKVRNDAVDRRQGTALSELKTQQAQAGQAAAHQREIEKQVNELAGKMLVEGTYTNPLDARKAAASALGIGDFNTPSAGGKNNDSITVDSRTGTPKKAVSKEQAEIYRKSVPSFDTINQSITGLRQAIKDGNTAAQESYSANIKDAIATTKGISRLPSMGQLEKVLPELLPEVHGTVMQYMPTHQTGSFTYNQTAQNQQLDRLEDMVKKSRDELDSQTYADSPHADAPGATPGLPKR
jgi:hypothetical protein